MFVGNGGSAGIASHLAIDFSKNGGMRAMAFNDPSALTCLGNDLGYENVFAKQIEFHGRAGDLLIAISSSGRSPNILNAVKAARAAQLQGRHIFGLHRGQRSALAPATSISSCDRENMDSSRWPIWRCATPSSTSIWAGRERA